MIDPYEGIEKKYPELYRHMNFIECGPGWFNLINELSEKLETIIVETDDLKDFEKPYALQVKEKFGTLRFYLSCQTHEIAKLIEEAESKSNEICEGCGEKGELIEEYGWFTCLCKECNKNQGE